MDRSFLPCTMNTVDNLRQALFDVLIRQMGYPLEAEAAVHQTLARFKVAHNRPQFPTIPAEPEVRGNVIPFPARPGSGLGV